jgi:hypothetical protein
MQETTTPLWGSQHSEGWYHQLVGCSQHAGDINICYPFRFASCVFWFDALLAHSIPLCVTVSTARAAARTPLLGPMCPDSPALLSHSNCQASQQYCLQQEVTAGEEGAAGWWVHHYCNQGTRLADGRGTEAGCVKHWVLLLAAATPRLQCMHGVNGFVCFQ